MHRMKILMPVLVVALFFGLSTTAEAGIVCGVSSTPVFRGTATGLTEPIGEVTFTCNGTPGATTDAIFTLEFGVPITNSEAYPAGGLGIRITDDTNDFSGLVTIAGVDNANGVITLMLPAVAVPDTVDPSEFTVTGVLVSLLGGTGSGLTVVVSSTPGDGYGIIAQQDVATVIRNVAHGLASIEITDTAEVLTDGTEVDDDFAFEITENYIDMFRTEAQFSEDGQTDATNSTEILVTFDGIPDDIDFVGCVASGTSGDPGISPTTITTTSNTAVISFDTAVLFASIDTVTVTCDVDADSAPRAGSVTVSATLHPNGTAFGPGTSVEDDPLDGGEIPRYDALEIVADGSVLDFGDPTTTLLIPFAMSLGEIDTGISIANTSNDPAAIDRADSITGPIEFWFFNQDADGDGAVGTPTYYMTDASSPGTGLDGDGLLAAGSSYLVNLSELLTAAGAPAGDFAGYVFIVTGFIEAHGGAFVVDWGGATNFTSVIDVLVVDGSETLDN